MFYVFIMEVLVDKATDYQITKLHATWWIGIRKKHYFMVNEWIYLNSYLNSYCTSILHFFPAISSISGCLLCESLSSRWSFCYLSCFLHQISWWQHKRVSYSFQISEGVGSSSPIRQKKHIWIFRSNTLQTG